MTSTALDAYGSIVCLLVVVSDAGSDMDRCTWFGAKRFAEALAYIRATSTAGCAETTEQQSLSCLVTFRFLPPRGET